MFPAISRHCLRGASALGRSLRVQSQRTFAEEAAAAASASTSGKMIFTFGSPSEAFYEASENVKQVDVPTGTGVIGVLANHVPTFGVLQPGVLTVTENEGTVNKYFVSSGSFSVNEDASVQIAAEEAVPVDYLDKDLARSNLAKAQSELASATDDMSRMEAQIAITCNEAIINA